jgi:hypothetical protein
MRSKLLALPLVLVSACQLHSNTTVLRELPDRSLPVSPDIGHEVMGYVVVSDAERVLSQIVLGPDGRPNSQLIHGALTSMLGIDPAIATALDLKRPAGFAMINPSLLASKTVQPYVAMLPITSRAQIEHELAVRQVSVERTPWGFAIAQPAQKGQRREKIYVGFAKHYALVAWRADLLEATRRLLAPKLAARPDAPLVVHVSFDNVYSAFGSQLGALMGYLQQRFDGNGGDPQMAFALRGLRQLTRYVGSLADVELLADLDSGGLTLTVRLDGAQDGEWAGFVAQQAPGPAWGVRFLPRDAALVYTTHASPRGRRDDLDSSLDLVADALPGKRPPPAELERWRASLARALAVSDGQLAYAVWPARGGGVGVGGAYRLSDPGTARAAVMGVYDQLGAQLGGLAVRALALDPAKFAPLVAVHKNIARVAGQEVDLVEVEIAWPERARAERRTFEGLFGPKLTLATAFIGEQALFALGADWQERLTAMIQTARGEGATSVGEEAGFVEALAFHDGARVSLTWLPTAQMAQLAANLVERAGELDGEQREAVAALVRSVGSGSIVSTTNATGRRYELTTHVPTATIQGSGRLNAALWKIALAPLFSPPMMPPMPVPPPQVTPSMSPLRPLPSPHGALPMPLHEKFSPP